MNRGTGGKTVTRDATGQFVKVTEAMARAWRKAGKSPIVEVWEKDPCTQAANALLDRCLDRPKEQGLNVNVGLDWEKRVARVQSARARAVELTPRRDEPDRRWRTSCSA